MYYLYCRVKIRKIYNYIRKIKHWIYHHFTIIIWLLHNRLIIGNYQYRNKHVFFFVICHWNAYFYHKAHVCLYLIIFNWWKNTNQYVNRKLIYYMIISIDSNFVISIEDDHTLRLNHRHYFHAFPSEGYYGDLDLKALRKLGFRK